MALKPHEVHLKLGEKILEESFNHDGFNNKICMDQAMVQYLLALGCTSITSEDKGQIQSRIESIYGRCSPKMQSDVNAAFVGQSKQQSIPLQPTQSKMNEDDEKVKSTVAACKVDTFRQISWDKVVLKPSIKQKVWDNIIIPLKNHKMKLPGILPGWLIFGCSSTGKSSLINAIMTECKSDGLDFYKVNCAEIFSPWQGLSPKIVKELFRQAHMSGLALIIFDEADALFR